MAPIIAPGGAAARPAYRLYILLLLLALNTLSYADRHLFSILIPAIKAEFDVNDSTLGLIGGPGFIVSYVLCSFPFARLADRWSRRGVLTLAATLWSAATAACGLAANAVQLAAARFAVGIGEAGGLPPSQSILASLYDERRRSGAMGVLASGTYFGVLVGLLGGAAIAQHWGWRAAFITLALPGLPLALLLWFTGPRRKVAAVAPAPPIDRKDSLVAAVRHCWSIPSLRLLAIGVGVFNIFGYAGAVWMPAFFMRSHGMTMVEAGSWLGLGAAIGGITGSMASGMIVDRLRRFGEHWQLRLPAFAFLLSFPLSLVMFTLPGGTALYLAGLAVPGVALIGVINGGLVACWAGPSFSAAARLVQPAYRSQAVAMLVVIINVIGSVFGPMLGGAVSDMLTARFGEESLRVSLLMMSVLVVLGGAFMWRASSHYPLDLQRAASTIVDLPPAPLRK